jgi:hypothetical protein
METKIQIGCNYHTTWQKNKAMRFVLVDVKADKVKLETRTTKRSFWTDIKDIVFIDTYVNRKKFKEFHKIKTEI